MPVLTSMLQGSLAILGFLSLVNAQNLVLAPATQPAAVPDVALQSTEVFQWTGTNGPQAFDAQMTVAFDEANRNVLSLEKFSNSLRAVDCDESMNFDFIDQATYEAAKGAWTWVNSDPVNDFILVANDVRCAADQQFKLWSVTQVAFNDAALRISATATQTEWEASAQKFNLNISHRENSAGIARRQDGQDVLDLNSDFTGPIFDSAALGLTQDINVELDCVNCQTSGILDFDFDVDVLGFIPIGASVTVFPRDIAANVEMALRISGNLTDPRTFEQELVNIPLGGLTIPGIVDFGPFMTVGVGAELTVSGEAELKFGSRVEISNDSFARLGFGSLSGDDDNDTWETTTNPIGPELSAQIDVAASVFTTVGVKLEASIFGFGFEGSLDIRAPELRATATAEASTEGACGTNQAFGVGLKVEAGVNIVLSAGFSGSDPFFSPSLFSTFNPLFEQCLAFGPEIGTEEGPAVEAPPAETPAEELPLAEGACSGATQRVVEGDNCDTISENAGISREEFLAANPSVNADCTNLILDSDVCVPTSATPSPEESPAESPLTESAAGSCAGTTQRVVSGDNCDTISQAAGISFEAFRAANPTINAECTNLILNTDVCIPATVSKRSLVAKRQKSIPLPKRHARQTSKIDLSVESVAT